MNKTFSNFARAAVLIVFAMALIFPSNAASINYSGTVRTGGGAGAGGVQIRVNVRYDVYVWVLFDWFYNSSRDELYYPVSNGAGGWGFGLGEPTNVEFRNINATIRENSNGGFLTDPTVYNVGASAGGLDFAAPSPFAASAPTVTTHAPSGVSTTTGTVNGTITPNGAFQPRWAFQYALELGMAGALQSPSPTVAPGGAANLDGVDDYLDVADGVYFNGGDFTMEGWTYVRNHANWSRMFDFGNGAGNANVLLALTAGTTGYPAMHVYNTVGGAICTIQSRVQIPLNQWVHLAAVRSGNVGLIYMNGAEVARGNFSAAPPNVNRTLNYIGRSNWADAYANALFDDLRIWQVARSAAEINNGRFQDLQGNGNVLLNYRFDQFGSATEVDIAAAAGQQNGTFNSGANPNAGGRTDNTLNAPGLPPTPLSINAIFTGLIPDTTYYYRAIATSAAGNPVGSVLNFTTPIATPGMTVANLIVDEDAGSFTIPITGITDNDATLDATYRIEVVVNDPTKVTLVAPTSATRPRYQYIHGAFTWNEAKRDAIRRGGHLVTITSAGEQTTAYGVVPPGINSGQAWIGLSDEVTEGVYRWDNNEVFSYSNWNAGEPNNFAGAEDYCHFVNGGRWNDLPPQSRLGYVLEYDDNLPPGSLYSTTGTLAAGTGSYNIQFNTIFNVNGATPITVRLFADYGNGKVQIKEQAITLTITPVDDGPTIGFGSTLDFNPAGAGRITLPADAYFNGPLTIESWVYLRSHQHWQRLLDFGNGPAAQNVLISLSEGTSGKPVFSIYNASGETRLTSADALPLNQWVHVAAVFDGTTGFVYINGDEKARGAMTPPENISRANNFIGRSNWGPGIDPDADMKISEFRIWNVARTPLELKISSRFPLPANEPGLQVYLRGIEGSGPLVRDFAATQGGIRNGTIEGSVNWILPGAAGALPIGSNTMRVPVGEDEERLLGLPAYDFEAAPLLAGSWTFVTLPTLGTLTQIVGVPGGWRFMPNPDVNGLDQFTYRITGNTQTRDYTVYLEISPDNDPPILSSIPNQNFLENTTNSVQFWVTDNETPIESLLFTITSSDQGVVPNSGLSVTGTGTNKVLVIRPNIGESGTTTITLRVTDTGAGAFPAKSDEVLFDVSFEPLPAFAILDINTLGSYTESEGVAINDKWEALGNASGNQQLSRTFLYGGPGSLTALKAFEPSSGVSTRGGALNNRSAVSFESITSGGIGSLVFDDGAARTPFTPPAATSTLLRGGLNDENVTAGSALISGSWRAVRADTPSSVAVNLNVPAGFNATWGYDINLANNVVGVASNANGNVRGFVHNGTSFTLIPLLAGGTNNAARGINKGGQVAGSSQTTVSDGTVLDLSSGRHVDLPDQAWFTGTGFAIEAWVYVRQHANHQRLLDFGNGQDANNVVFALSTATDGKPYLDVLQGASRVRVTSPTALPLNTWTHVAAVFTGTDGIIYINGAAVITGTMQAPLNLTRTKNYIGKSNWASDAAGNFLVDNLRIWGASRTAAQVMADKEAITLAGTPGLMAQYLFDEGAGDSAQDSSGNNRHGTLVGGSIYSGPNGLAYGPVVNRAILYSLGATANLGTLPNGGDSVGFAVNEFGKVAGQAIAEGKVNATLHAAGTLHNLNLLVSEEDDVAWHLNDARAINKHGAVVGTGIKGGVKRAYMALPATVVGRKVVRPQGAVTNFAPDIEIVDGKGYGDLPGQFFYWSPGESKLFATRPCIARLKWYISTVISTNTDRIEVLTANIWPRVPTVHVVGAPVDLEPKPTNSVFGFTYQQLHYPDEQTLTVIIDASTKSFDARQSGWSVVRYLRTNGQTPDPLRQPAYFEVVRSYAYNDQKVFKDNVNWLVGDTIENATHFDYGKNGWVFFEKSFYDGDGPDRAYDRPTRRGPIIPVNTDTQFSDDLVVGWYHTNQIGVAWASEAWRYSLAWPEDTTNKIIIASQLGTTRIDETLIREPRVYVQPDASRPGFNPNEEHALMAPSDSGQAMFALRNDLNALENFSRPFSLLKYKDLNGEWRVKVYKVLAEEAPYFFRYPGVAGREIQAPYPLSVLQICDQSFYETGPGWEDYHGKIYARAAGQYGGQTNIIIRYYYPLQPTFYSPKKPDSAANYVIGECMPWLDRLPATRPGTPNVTTFVISWPDDVPFLNIGQSALKPINGLPDFLHMADAKIIYDDNSLNSGNDLANLARLYDPLSPRTYRLASTEKIPDAILRLNINGKEQFKDLPWSLRIRLNFDPINKWLSFEGYFQPDFDVGDPLLLPNIMTDLERRRLVELAPNDVKWVAIVQKLYDLTRNPNQLDSNWDGSVDQALLMGLELTTNTIQINQAQALLVTLGISPLVKPAQVISTTPGANLMTDLKYRFIRPQQFGDITKALTAGFNVPTANARPLQAAEFNGSGAGLQTGAGIGGIL